MRINRNIAAVLALIALAFAAGRAGWLGAGPEASAGPMQEQEMADEMPPDMPPDLSPEMMKAMKMGAPGEHHEYLNTLVGAWDGTFRIRMEPDAEPMISKGTITREWVLDGRFIREVVESNTDWGPFRAISYLGYNNVDGQYESVWMESVSTGIYYSTGSYNPDTQIMRTRATYRNPVTGKVEYSRYISDLSDPDRHVFEGYMTGQDGKEYKSFHGVMERRTKKK
ncbi:MAG: DUF1579 family protein [Planctomycetota bacterium]|nr:DUF1579 family protein [Planctomycetota bacterium]